jgi:hypothetical protein
MPVGLNIPINSALRRNTEVDVRTGILETLPCLIQDVQTGCTNLQDVES